MSEAVPKIDLAPADVTLEAGRPPVDLAPAGMTAESAMPRRSNGLGPRPYAPSWINRLTWRIEALPAPATVAYLLFAAAAMLISNAQDWIAGTVPFPGLTLQQTYWGALAAFLLALIPYLDGVATASLEAFEPALKDVEVEVDLAALRYELTVIPARPALMVTGLAVAATLAGFISDPDGSGIAGYPPLAVALYAAGQSLVLSLLFLLMYHTLRQLRAVARIHAMPAQVSLFRPAPLYAFSQLTVRTAIAFVAIVSTTVLVNASTLQNSPAVITVPFLVGGITVALAAFVLPLQGMHRRISHEKRELEWQAGRRIVAATAEIHRAIDDHDHSGADGLNKLLGSLIAEREMLARLPTWPWQPGAVGALVTAIVLPIVIFVVTRLLQGWL